MLSLLFISLASTASFAEDAKPTIDPTVDRLLGIIEAQLSHSNNLNYLLIKENRELTDKLQKNCEKKSLRERLFGKSSDTI